MSSTHTPLLCCLSNYQFAHFFRFQGYTINDWIYVELSWDGKQFVVSQTLVGGSTQSGGPYQFTGKQIQYDAIQYNTIQYNSIRHDTTRCATRHDTTRHDTTRHDTTRHDTTRYDTIQYKRFSSTFIHVGNCYTLYGK